ncbi:metalloregulator ArsR/SmtB family transcription factor [Aquamicrobium sp. LC103]|uniref:ArsR/SmtB family transcription factor n=1 Tax=Aquamicrobium sp. LC103 TaxID=1120658 RepID=UPI00063EB91E|nr:metalloregulator ArsR/SmtB family transcription factor [Aquamicrobium sp. LC103]TKT82599.1 winged helix-turn-helix transcriptional regulator [Aquamicrobium sp. LC103]
MTTLDHSFAALADPTRRAIIARLAEGEATVQDLARPFSISQPAISRHLKVLEEAGLIETRVEGTARPRRLKPDAVEALWDWLGQYRALWETQFQKLDAVLDGLPDEAGQIASGNPERSTP